MSIKKINKNQYFGYRSFLPEWETMKKFRAIGVDTFTVMVSNGLNASGRPYTKYQPVWVDDHQYDFTMVENQINDLLAAVPDAKIICYIDLNPPAWWVRRGGGWGYRYDSYYELGKICQSKQWQDDITDYFQNLLKFIEAKFPKQILAYIYNAGATSEWFDRSNGEESIYRLQGFKRWCKANNKPMPVDIPPRSLREHCPYETDNLDKIYVEFDPNEDYEGECAPSGMFRTPAEDEHALDYWHFNNDQIADMAILFAKKAREIIRPEVELGTTFGYVTDLGDKSLVSNGQLEYERVFDTEEIDFMLAPATYWDRAMGGGSGSMIPMETLHMGGKRMLNSCDHRTYTMKVSEQFWKGIPHWENAAEVEAGVKRELAFNLISQSSTWWFDMLGGWWDSKAAMDSIAKSKEIWDYETKQEIEDVSEILMIHDPDNIYYVNDQRPDVAKFNRSIHSHLNRVGAPHAIGSFNDLKKTDLTRFKLIIMCYPFELTPEKTEILEKYVYNFNHTVLWFYGPGIIKDGKWTPENVEKICGTAFKTPGINTVNMGEWQSVYVADPDDLNPENVREIAQAAGVHIYSSKLRPIFANNRLIAVHTGEAETLTLTLPQNCKKITELYTGKVYENTQSVELTTTGPKTFLFRYE